jgi:hypothetical protein
MNVGNKTDLSGDKEDVAAWIWSNLVPRSGPASTLQGELLRAIEKLRWEAQSNGNINWDEGFVMFVDFLEEHLILKSTLTPEAKDSMAQDLRRLREFLPVEDLKDDSEAGQLPYVDDDLYDRLVFNLVDYCRLHPQILPHEPDARQYR